MMKHYKSLAASLILLVPVLAISQEEAMTFSGNVIPGVQISSDPASSKFNEYRDINDGVFLPGFGLDYFRNDSGIFLESTGTSIFRDDQNIRATIGKRGSWKLGLEWDELPHRLSNTAATPYINAGDGNLTKPASVALVLKDLDSTTDANDQAIAAYLAQYTQPTTLGFQRNTGTAMFQYNLMDSLKFKVSFANENKEGTKIAYGPIGDRPPRTSNVQLPEPVDQRSQDLRIEADYVQDGYQVNLSYLFSNFKTEFDAMTWQNIYTTGAGTEEAWGDTKSVATAGRRALFPDNQFHNVTATAGVDLPWDSRLTGNVSMGWMRQDAALIPYSTNATVDSGTGGDNKAWSDPTKLTSSTAQGAIDTKSVNFDYSISPLNPLHLNAYFHYYDLDNKTPEQDWRYVTQDTVKSTDGSVSYLNKRRNVAYEYNKKEFGLDSTYALGFWRSSLGLGYERENLNHAYREANTGENILKTSFRMRPVNWLTFRAKYQYGKRSEQDFVANAASSSYVYDASEATNNTAGTAANDPKFSFENHPDTRQFDVSDRTRKNFSAVASTTLFSDLDLSASVLARTDNFDSHVTSTAPLADYAGTRPVDRTAVTPGDQLGLLNSELVRVGLDTSYPIGKDITLSAYGSYEKFGSLQRGLEHDENAKTNPSGAGAVGRWDSAAQQWTADVGDTTRTVGLGATFVMIPGRLAFSTGHTYSYGKLELIYGGHGTQFADNNQFGFRTPPEVTHVRYTADISLDYQLIKDLNVGLGYMFERYRVEDWMQDPNTPWHEAVAGRDDIVRDTSVSGQMGNRLPNMGSYLAPSYVAHVGTVTLTYKF